MAIIENSRKKELEEDEIEVRLVDIIQFLKDSRKSVIIWGATFFIIGVVYAFSQQDEYTATIKVMPELKSSTTTGGLGDLKSLAGLAGVNLNSINNNSDAIRPDLYPDIVQSIPFSLYLLDQRVTTTKNAKPQKLQTYLSAQSNKSILSFTGSLIGDEEEKNPVILIPKMDSPTLLLTRQQETLSKIINKHVGAEMDKKTGIITITSRMPDAIVTAIVARQTLDYLTKYVTNYRTGKARKQLEFLNQQVNNARHRYQSSELQLSTYRDQNRNIFLNAAKIEEQRLQAEYLLTQDVYRDLSKQLEQARIKLEEEAPIFQILEPSQVPLHKSGPKRPIIVFGFVIFGAVIGLIVFMVRRFVKK